MRIVGHVPQGLSLVLAMTIYATCPRVLYAPAEARAPP